jgi:uncharacterized tellurite resistance protein B-like protein
MEELMNLEHTINFKLAKLLIALAWADGEISNDETNVIKDVLFSVSKVSSKEWQILEMYMDTPIPPEETQVLLQDVLDSIKTSADQKEVIEQLEALVAADGEITKDEKALLAEIKEAVETKSTGILNIFGKISGIFKDKSLKQNTREDNFEDYINNKILYDFKNLHPAEAAKMSETKLKVICAAAAILGRVAGFDRDFTDNEYSIIKNTLVQEWNISKIEAGFLTDILKKRTVNNINYTHLVHLFFQNTSYIERKNFVISLFKIADSTNHVSYEELDEIKTLSACLKISHPDFIEAKLTIPREHRNGF